jgi:hypothetical protein
MATSTATEKGIAGSGVGFDGLRRIEEMSERVDLACRPELDEVDLLLLDLLAGRFDGQLDLDQNRDAVASREEGVRVENGPSAAFCAVLATGACSQRTSSARRSRIAATSPRPKAS